MVFEETPIPGCYLIELDQLADERGWFARSFDVEEFERRGLDATIVQCNISYTERARTLRGLHYQAAPHGESKLVRCSHGAIFDVVVDLRPDSSAYCEWYGVELSGENRKLLFAPPDLAHGFLSLTDGTEVQYQMGHPYVPEAQRGVRWDDPAFGIEWPASPTTISERDASLPDFVPRREAGAGSRS